MPHALNFCDSVSVGCLVTFVNSDSGGSHPASIVRQIVGAVPAELRPPATRRAFINTWHKVARAGCCTMLWDS